MTRDPADLAHLERALRLAAKGRYRVSPNPMVGAVLVKEGELVGDGFHRQVGGPHAEREALAAAGERARGATLYVTLEPCSHFGRTPPCADAVIEAGIRRVVACHQDPNPQVAGQGFEKLRRAGIAVDWGYLIEEAVTLNHHFLLAATLERPAVTLKWAMSLDGRIATASGESQWISSPAARRWSLHLREEHDAILVGSGTVLADDPRLTRRQGKAQGPITRVIVDRRLRTPPTAQTLREPGEVLLYTRASTASSQRPAISALEAAGATVVALPQPQPGAILTDLFARGVRSVLVEGGGEIHAAFVAAGLYDQVVVDCAPLLVGGQRAPGPLGGDGVRALAQAPRLRGLRPWRRGGDWILRAFRQGCLEELMDKVSPAGG